MTTTLLEQLQVYKCQGCGMIVEVLRGGEGQLTCCNQPMSLLTENTVDASREKHVPVIDRIAGGFTVSIGSIPHPMEEKHFIEWIELIADGQSYRQFLQPGDVPTATFLVTASQVSVREHCNLHGLWKAEVSA